MSGLFETLSGAKGIRADAKSQQNLANVNAARAEVAAEAERKKAGFASKRQAKRASEIESELEAKLGAAGGLGSPVAGDLIGEQAEELELENLLIGFEGEVAARRLEEQAEVDRFTGRIAKQRGKIGARAANVQFGLQLATVGFLGGFGGPKPLAGNQAAISKFGGLKTAAAKARTFL